MPLFRALLVLVYLAVEGFLSDAQLSRIGGVFICLFAIYSVILLVYQSRPAVKSFRLLVLFLDLVFLLSLIFWGTTPASAALAGVFYGFLVLESWAQQGAREVILIA